ncbi:hypothetical protein ROZALSC1DRAFT_26953 [Rozella allomycis CSF55]|uniref:Mitochondrial mRNA-processing protein COX24 C-terminal domain-containing protein n=1 Tax=Rozella allomycis (strain CSF55) TaxID=988480 RepID=A0A075AWT1_ROZAC|nr:hypothetical protein O9G_005232 [Rozella allomycis CSF55]RKP21666.1 hypothetical protein ROZALSC1DRAFT_26953 [Rozella allomycis CSF55]|eukprot:EPZ34795.1 hypothetical protein O9G_005232 [Rozella allomycis CSF55]
MYLPLFRPFLRHFHVSPHFKPGFISSSQIPGVIASSKAMQSKTKTIPALRLLLKKIPEQELESFLKTHKNGEDDNRYDPFGVVPTFIDEEEWLEIKNKLRAQIVRGILPVMEVVSPRQLRRRKMNRQKRKKRLKATRLQRREKQRQRKERRDAKRAEKERKKLERQARYDQKRKERKWRRANAEKLPDIN